MAANSLQKHRVRQCGAPHRGCGCKALVDRRIHRWQSRNASTADTQMEPCGLERFTGRQLGFNCAWRCRAQGTPDWNTPPPSGVLISGLSPPGWGRFLDIRIWPFKALVEGDHAIAAVRWPLMQVALAVAIVGCLFRAQDRQHAPQAQPSRSPNHSW